MVQWHTCHSMQNQLTEVATLSMLVLMLNYTPYLDQQVSGVADTLASITTNVNLARLHIGEQSN